MLAETLDTSFHSVDELRGFTSVPVLSSSPRIVTEADRQRGSGGSGWRRQGRCWGWS